MSMAISGTGDVDDLSPSHRLVVSRTTLILSSLSPSLLDEEEHAAVWRWNGMV